MTGATAQHLSVAAGPGGADGAHRLILEQFVTGVAVLTCGDAQDVEGVTVSTLTLASRRPPMVSVALRRGSRGLQALLTTRTFVVNALGARQADLARHFARRHRARGVGQLAGEAWSDRTEDGVPVLVDAVGWLTCRVRGTVEVGDHELVLAQVERAVRGAGAPLLNYAGGLHGLAEATLHTERD
ncbi:flavin reductase family protein [Kitasatospora griseola]|uniref:flavin reductase family protein n=1 Tax=Kitasatospora griseola TaxID=2064 RepID=UPI0038129CD0